MHVTPPPPPAVEPRYEQPRYEAAEREVEAPRQAEAPRQVEAPRYEAPREEAPRRQEPKVDPKQLLESAGLVMIETDRAKAPPAPVTDEPQPLGRPRRERPKVQESDDLVQIETGLKK